MNQETNNILKNCQLIVILVSVIFLGFAICDSLSVYHFENNAISVKAKITGVNSDERTQGSHIIISYRANEKNYNKLIYEYRSSWYEGKQIVALYDPKNPKHVRIKESLYTQPILFGLLGLFFLIVTIILVTYQQQVQTKQKKLITSGNLVQAKVIGCMANSRIKLNGRHPYRIEATYEDLFSKAIYHFESQNIYHNPPNMLGMHVSVYVNPSNPNDYYMDLGSLRK